MSRFLFSRSARRGAAGVAAPLFATFASALAVTAVTFAPASASAHFILQDPPNWKTQVEGDGSPQKQAPCGNEAGGTETGIVTPFTAGQKITITIDETVTHGGHYRVALALSDMNDLPKDYTSAQSGNQCQNDDMQATPMYPILADGMLEHAQNQPFSAPQSFEVTLPSDVTCDKCVLQVREYMTPHAPTCYYHHCAMIQIKPAGAGGAGGMSSGGAPSTGAGGMSSGGAPGASGMGGVATSMGGMLGQAGMSVSLGGSSSGAASAGRPGGAGAPDSSGMASSAGGSSPGTGGVPATGTGGAPGGGTGGTATSAAGTHGSSEPSASSEDQSGGCGIAGQPGRGPFGVLAALGVGLWLARRRRR